MNYISRITAKYFHKGLNKYIYFIVPCQDFEDNIILKVNIEKYTHLTVEDEKINYNKTSLGKDFADFIKKYHNEIIEEVKNCYVDVLKNEKCCHLRYSPYIFSDDSKYSIYYDGVVINTINAANKDFFIKSSKFQAAIDDMLCGKVALINWKMKKLSRKIQLE